MKKCLRFGYFLLAALLFVATAPLDCLGRHWNFSKDNNPQAWDDENACVLTDRELQDLLSSSNRVACNMSGKGNNCGFYAILSQAKAEDFGGEALSPSGHAHGEANVAVKVLRQKTDTPIGEMFETVKIQKVSDYYRRPVVVIGHDSGQIEFVFPFGDAYEVLTRLNFKENFSEWLGEYLIPRTEELEKILDALQQFVQDVDVRTGTVYEVLVGLLRNPKTIGMLHVDGNHFQALQPVVNAK